MNMFCKLNPQQVETAAHDLGSIHSILKSARVDIDDIRRRLEYSPRSFFGISNALAIQANNMDALISKLASMEDGLEQAVTLYLRYELMLAGGTAQAEQAIFASGGGIKDWWSNLVDWFQTGVWDDKEKADRVRNDKAMAAELKSLLKSDRYSKKAWKKATVEERKKILTELFDEMQRIYGVTVNQIMITPIESEPGYTTYGYYSNFYSKICINEDLLSDPSYYNKIMDTMAHEMRHAYQHAVVRNPEQYQVDEATVEEWRNNIYDYKTTEDDGYDAYRNQPIEKDARKFASWVI